MKLFIVIVRDIVANKFAQPQYVDALGSGERSFRDACEDKTTQIGKHPADYELYLRGTYDDDTGEIEQEPLRQIAVGKNYANRA